jgi:hypothetical protein
MKLVKIIDPENIWFGRFGVVHEEYLYRENSLVSLLGTDRTTGVQTNKLVIISEKFIDRAFSFYEDFHNANTLPAGELTSDLEK